MKHNTQHIVGIMKNFQQNNLNQKYKFKSL